MKVVPIARNTGSGFFAAFAIAESFGEMSLRFTVKENPATRRGYHKDPKARRKKPAPLRCSGLPDLVGSNFRIEWLPMFPLINPAGQIGGRRIWRPSENNFQSEDTRNHDLHFLCLGGFVVHPLSQSQRLCCSSSIVACACFWNS